MKTSTLLPFVILAGCGSAARVETAMPAEPMGLQPETSPSEVRCDPQCGENAVCLGAVDNGRCFCADGHVGTPIEQCTPSAETPVYGADVTHLADYSSSGSSFDEFLISATPDGNRLVASSPQETILFQRVDGDWQRHTVIGPNGNPTLSHDGMTLMIHHGREISVARFEGESFANFEVVLRGERNDFFNAALSGNGSTVAAANYDQDTPTLMIATRRGRSWATETLTVPASASSNFGIAMQFWSDGRQLAVAHNSGGGVGTRGGVRIYSRTRRWDEGSEVDRPEGAYEFGRYLQVTSDRDRFVSNTGFECQRTRRDWRCDATGIPNAERFGLSLDGETMATSCMQGPYVCVFLKVDGRWIERSPLNIPQSASPMGDPRFSESYGRFSNATVVGESVVLTTSYAGLFVYDRGH